MNVGKEEAYTYPRTTCTNHMQVNIKFLCDGCETGHNHCVVGAHILDLGGVQERSNAG